MSQEDRAGFDAAGTMTRQHWPGVHRAGVLLTKEKRQAVWAVMAMCHLVRQAAETPETIDLLEDRLSEMAEAKLDLPRCEFRSQDQHVLHAVGLVIRRYQLPVQVFLDLARSRVTELTVKRFATWASLEKYCRGAMGTTTQLVAGVLGSQHSEVGERSMELGTAIQLTTILRDIRKDAAEGTVYLPLEDLHRFGCTDVDIQRGEASEKVTKVIEFETARARELYRTGAEGIAWLAGNSEKLFAAAVTLRSSDGLPNHKRGRPFSFAGRMWKLTRRTAQDPMPDVF